VTLRQTSALRFQIVLAWAGLVLVVLGASALVLAVTWQTSSLVLLAAAHSGTGLLLLVASSIRS
jgi:hypothetical protein